MAQVLNLRPTPLIRPLRNDSNPRWAILQQKFGSSGRFSCLFSDNRKQEQARKALESALGGKKIEFEKWNKEIQKREEAGGGDNAGGGGWFGGGRWFGGSNGDHFWQEAQQASLAVLGIILVYLLITKGNIMLAVFFNSLLFVLRGTRNGFTYISSRITGKVSPSYPFSHQNESRAKQAQISAKDSVVRKWGTD